MKFRVDRPAVLLWNEVNRESLRNAYRFQYTFLGIDAVLEFDVVIVSRVQGTAQPRHNSVWMADDPGNNLPYAMAGLRFQYFHHFWTAVKNVTASSGWYKVEIEVT